MAAIFLMFVITIIPIQSIFTLGFDCYSVDYGTIMSCDQCIRCGGFWCISPGPEEPHCSRINFGENMCKSYVEEEILPSFDGHTIGGNKTSIIWPTTVVDSINIANVHHQRFDTPCKANNVITNVTDYKGSPPEITLHRKDNNGKCGYDMEININFDFCTESNELFQNFTVPLEVDGVTQATAHYKVICKCKCSQNVLKNDARCNYHGNFSCGVCACNKDWTGTHCDQKTPYDAQEYVEPATYNTCPSVRGDVNCIHDMRPNVECSGNGRCEDCCLCDKTKDGWQYFDWNNYCEDICMTTNKVLDKEENDTDIYFLKYDETESLKRDSKHRNVWVKCEEMVNDCVWTYYARKNVKDQIAVMVSDKDCPNADAVIGVNVIALSVPLSVAALVMAAVGYYFWHRKGAAPLSAGNYQGLDGPRTRVETNPTYIEPIKSYKNPTYGQQV